MMKSAIFRVGARLVPLCLVFHPLFCSVSAAPSCSVDGVTPWAVRPTAMDVCLWEENTVWLDDNATAEKENPLRQVAGGFQNDGREGGVPVSSAAVDDKDGDPSRRGAASLQRITPISAVLVEEQPLLLEPAEEGFMVDIMALHGSVVRQLYSVLVAGLVCCILGSRVWRLSRNLKRLAWTSRDRKEAWRATCNYFRSWATVTSKAMRFLAEDWRDWRAQPVPSWATRPPPARVGVLGRVCTDVRWWLWMVWLGGSTLMSGMWGELCGTKTTTATTAQPPPRATEPTAQPPPRATEPTTQPPPRATHPTPGPNVAEDWHAWKLHPVRERPVRQQRPAIQDGIGVWARRVWSDVGWWIWFVWFGISTFWCELRKELRRTDFDGSDEEELQPSSTASAGAQRPKAASGTRLPKGAKAASRKAMKPRAR